MVLTEYEDQKTRNLKKQCLICIYSPRLLGPLASVGDSLRLFVEF